MQTSSPSSVSAQLNILMKGNVTKFVSLSLLFTQADFTNSTAFLLNRFQLPPFETEDPSEQLQLIKEATQRHGVGISGYHFYNLSHCCSQCYLTFRYGLTVQSLQVLTHVDSC